MSATTLIPETAPFKAEQRLWLNGYMAGLLAGKGYVPGGEALARKESLATVPLLILFGSQTGTSEKLAKQAVKQAKSQGCNSRALEAGQYATVDWSKETNLLVITSTYGDGDMPDNAQAFWDWLQTDAAKCLSQITFSVLALGDTNYEQFCAAGKKIDARLEGLGARRASPLVLCDLDYEAKAKEWMANAISALLPTSAAVASSSLIEIKTEETARWSKGKPFPARLLTNRRLNGQGSEKETRHFEISLEGSGLSYEAGDALGVWPTNCPELVEDILQAMGNRGEEMVKVSGAEVSLREALTRKLDVSKTSMELLQYYSGTNSTLAALLAPERREDLKQWQWGRGVIDLLLENPGTTISATEMVRLLKPLTPRLYSISSSPKAHLGQVHLTINVVRYAAHGRARKGIASTFLADRASGSVDVPVFVQTSHGFRLPAKTDIPIIMIGPGTGVAPFRAFLHERRASGASGRNWLFFGEQRAETDFYYKDELHQMLADGSLSNLSVAFSRDQQEKIYVQLRMLENARDLWGWLEEGAHFYVCGDATRMAKDVDTALHRVIETAGNKSADEAKAYIAKLKSEKRYQRDVY